MSSLSLILITSTLLMTGCSTTLNKSQQSSSIDIATKTDLTADIDVNMSNVLKGSAKQVTILGFIDLEKAEQFVDGVTYNGASSGSSLFSGGIIESTKAAAAFRAIAKQDVDVLVAPQYLVRVDSKFMGFYKKVTVTVSGYAGKIRNIRSADKR
jgi:hypothetical protein